MFCFGFLLFVCLFCCLLFVFCFCFFFVLFCFVLYSEGVIMIDYPENGKTINRQYYASELRQLKETIKSRGNLKAGVLFPWKTRPFTLIRLQYLKQPTAALKCHTVPLTHQTEVHLTFSYFLNSNSTCVVAIFETMMRSYKLWGNFRKNVTFFFSSFNIKRHQTEK